MDVPPGGIQYQDFLAKEVLLMERGARIAEASGQHKRKPNSRLPAPRLPMTSSSCGGP